MSKKLFIERMKEKEIAQAEAVYDAMMDIITSELQEGNEVSLNGIGKLKVKTRKARKGLNPKTGEKIQIAEKNAVTFTASKTIKEALN